MLLVPRFASGSEFEEDRKLLLSADVIFILLELFIILPYIIHGALSTLATRQSLELIFDGTLGWLFWLGVVLLGLLVPLLAEVASLAPTLAGGRPLRIPHAVEATAALLVLVGGFLLRYVFVYAGQISRIG
jgi:polysulfide reductase chain C